MRSTYKQLYYINRSKVKSDGTTSIMCRITIDGKVLYYQPGCIASRKSGTARKGKSRTTD